MKKIYFLLLALGLFTSVNAQVINFPDANFKAKLLRPNQYGLYDLTTGNPQPMIYQVARDINNNPIVIDQNNDGNIQQSEALNVYYLNVAMNAGMPQQYFGSDVFISNLSGIQYFTNLRRLDCSNNQLTTLSLNSLLNITYLNCSSNQLINIDVTQNTLLKDFVCGYNQLTNINVTQNTALTSLLLHNNQLTNIDVAQNIALTQLELGYNQLTNVNVTQNTVLASLLLNNNQLTSLDVSQNTAMYYFSFEYNQLTNIDLSHNVALGSFGCRNNQLTSLNLTNNNQLNFLECRNNLISNLNINQNGLLNWLNCSNNLLTTLDCSHNKFNYLNCSNNQLVNLNIKNGFVETPLNLDFSNNANLGYICADENQLIDVQNKIATYGYTNCNLNSYCSFTPGGTYYTIQGNNKFDTNNNGCDALDLGFPNLKFNITDGTVSGSSIANTSGNYTIPVQAGTYTLTPVFENPAYFTISPATVNVTFPAQASPFTQNFCVAANGIHPDLEVTLLPISSARPGFDATYRLIYKNKGNTTQSGTVSLAYYPFLSFVLANPNTTSQNMNVLYWAFTNLMPFESREITLTLHVNTPAIHAGEIIQCSSTIGSAVTDDTPADNTFVLYQTVVNSFDPNDKTCLEGAILTPDKAGEYVHYVIRFENTGTANAQNIVVKDMIDLAKFDINSLVPMKGSHSFVTNITSGNKVEFIFQNINLPFDDANNDGFVAFKIKTLPTLGNDSTFSNTASIYFDYNAPIITNTATSMFTALSVKDFEFSNYFSLYPNPVHDVLNISTKQNIEVNSISIYNMLGQLVLVIPNAKNTKTVDVSSLKTGNYFIKINSDKGTSNAKFIKK